ncbi:hypothetical protein, partial [Streptomyces thermocarboxydus]|uniref:hypothetical protein n=1 Tax=Streptomyces thermocarboxydus TaxID=59299 RepID=UPI0021649C58
MKRGRTAGGCPPAVVHGGGTPRPEAQPELPQDDEEPPPQDDEEPPPQDDEEPPPQDDGLPQEEPPPQEAEVSPNSRRR